MDTFTLLVAIILFGLALQSGQNWIVFGTILLLMVSMRSFKAAILLLLALVVLFISRDSYELHWPIVIFGLIVLALLLGIKEQEQQPEMYMPGGGGDMGGMLGGLGGGGY